MSKPGTAIYQLSSSPQCYHGYINSYHGYSRKRRRSEGDSSIRLKEKNKYLSDLVRSDKLTLQDIRELALSEGGLLTNEFRRVLWLKVLGIQSNDIIKECDITEFHEYTQVCLDVHRCNSRIKAGTSHTKTMSIKNNLKKVIIKSLADRPCRHYYQGYHDISLTMLYVLSDRLACLVMSRLCTSHLSSHIRPSLDETAQQMRLIVPLVSQRSPDLADFMIKSEAGTMFSLSWIITWFAYVINDETVISRLYDVFITHPPLMTVYLSAAIVLYRKRDIMAVECELSEVHQVLHSLPQNLPFDLLIQHAHDLLTEYPPSLVKALPIKQHEMILKVPRSGYLDWSKNWAKKLYEYANTPTGIAVTSSLIVGFAAFLVSVYTNKLNI